MNKKIYEVLENEINDYKSSFTNNFGSNAAIFNIFDNFFHEVIGGDYSIEEYGVKLNGIVYNQRLVREFDVMDCAYDGGITFVFEFDGNPYSIGFISYKEGGEIKYSIRVASTNEVNYSGYFIYKYLLYSALEKSKLKGAYFTMPRNQFEWEVKTLEGRGFNDIFLPKSILDNVHLYVDIFKTHGKLLRYLKVGNPGVGKTESTIVIANQLNKMGVTIIKTTICEALHQKVELANVLAPSVIILDDIDLSLGNRNSNGFSKLLGDFLDVLDGTDKLADNVGIIATTNAAHLLDLAAQRPGRFDKTVLFDNITKGNIKDIILKSLKYNFNIESGDEVTTYTNKIIIDKFYDDGITGSHVFNMIKMLKLRFDTLGQTPTIEAIIESVNHELEVLKKVRKQSYLEDKIRRENQSVIGFGRIQDEDEGLEESWDTTPSIGEKYSDEGFE